MYSAPPIVGESQYSQLLAFWGKTIVEYDLIKYNDDNKCNSVTPFFDAGFLYGDSEEEEMELRIGARECELKLNKPYNTLPTLSCNSSVVEKYQNMSSLPCVGDPRVSSSLQALAITNLLAIEHNRICSKFHGKVNRGNYFYATKRKIQKLIKRITYEEWLPAVVGDIDGDRVTLKLAHSHSSVVDISIEFVVMLPQLLYAMAADHVAVGDNMLAYTFEEGMYNNRVLMNRPSQVCNILHGMMLTPLNSVGLHAPEGAPLTTECRVSREFNLTNLLTTGPETELFIQMKLEQHGPRDTDVIGENTRRVLLDTLRNLRDSDSDYISKKSDRTDNLLYSLIHRHCKHIVRSRPRGVHSFDALDLSSDSMSSENNKQKTENIIVIAVSMIVSFFIAIFLAIVFS
jgi:hypothetical protein